jgi:predicted GIY-YIG superfamily endonuclease
MGQRKSADVATTISYFVIAGLDPAIHASGRMKSYWVYILTSRPRGTLYVGMTNDLIRRLYQHREGLADGFTKEHGVKMLVYYREHATAIQREKTSSIGRANGKSI